jgi:hypothetical protein
MILVLLLIVAVISFVVFAKFFEDIDAIMAISLILGVFAAFAFVIGLIILPIARADALRFLVQMDEIERTVEDLSNTEGVEKATIYREIIAVNRKLVAMQYYANSIWVGIYYPDAIRHRKPIRVN